MPFSFSTRRGVFLALACALACSMVLLLACDKPSESTSTSSTCFRTLEHHENIALCEASPDDYQPRNHLGSWGSHSCTINDTPNQYRAINETDISTITRMAAFEEIAKLLWKHSHAPSRQDFEDARVFYAENEGLDSRVQRREDVHFPVLPECLRCNMASQAVQEQHADRCAGPIKIRPIINEAFVQGHQQNQPLVQAQRIKAALLWFNYLSSLSEVQTCANEPKNCDSAWAYYTGGTSRDTLQGLATYIHAVSPETHHMAYDAALAVRCWRDVDPATPAANTDLQYRALKQYDKALSRGMALILRQKMVEWRNAVAVDPEVSSARQAFVQTLFLLMENNLLGFAKTGGLQHPQSTALLNELKTLLNNPSPDFAAIGRMNELWGSLFLCP